MGKSHKVLLSVFTTALFMIFNQHSIVSPKPIITAFSKLAILILSLIQLLHFLGIAELKIKIS